MTTYISGAGQKKPKGKRLITYVFATALGETLFSYLRNQQCLHHVKHSHLKMFSQPSHETLWCPQEFPVMFERQPAWHGAQHGCSALWSRSPLSLQAGYVCGAYFHSPLGVCLAFP